MTPRADPRAAEDAAADFLRRQGYRILRRNFATPFGEIDLIALDEAMVVFVEVKSRVSDEFGPPEAAVDRRKQARLRRIAQYFLDRQALTEMPCRFDVVALTRRPEGAGWSIELFRDAF
ncbi:MAG TPA: YraN family protein [Planctomycetota bacterium]|nr:YraN family protein [Planctomycetota bacterium]HRR79837.1 YraN family protein [Planctomycetota bacterium]HRT92913.1 YraN family protein [Planctomycetota bacterium]